MPRATTRQHGGSPRSTIGVATPDRLLRLTNAKPGGQSQRSDGTEAAPNDQDHGAAVIDFPFNTDDDGRSRASPGSATSGFVVSIDSALR